MKIDLSAGLVNTVEIPVYTITGGLQINHFSKALANLKICR